MNNTQILCRQIRSRSLENRNAIAVLQNSPGQMVSILRQELDSMVRVVYILTQKKIAYRDQLIQKAVDGEKWTQFGAKKKVTDKEMVDLAQELHGWTQSVYSFGCGFIHLSRFHDYKDRDPFGKISRDMHDDIIRHMNQYRGWPINQNITFAELTRYIPMVFDKISSNLGCYLKDLENGGVIN